MQLEINLTLIPFNGANIIFEIKKNLEHFIKHKRASKHRSPFEIKKKT